MTQPKTYIVAVLALILGLAAGWFAGTRMAYQSNESYTEQMLKDARFAQAKERATLARLLEKGDVPKAKELVYIVLSGNFKDYALATDERQRTQACELLERLNDGFQAPLDPSAAGSRQALIEQVRAATAHCKSFFKQK
jgi:hypothetical protein